MDFTVAFEPVVDFGTGTVLGEAGRDFSAVGGGAAADDRPRKSNIPFFLTGESTLSIALLRCPTLTSGGGKATAGAGTLATVLAGLTTTAIFLLALLLLPPPPAAVAALLPCLDCAAGVVGAVYVAPVAGATDGAARATGVFIAEVEEDKDENWTGEDRKPKKPPLPPPFSLALLPADAFFTSLVEDETFAAATALVDAATAAAADGAAAGDEATVLPFIAKAGWSGASSSVEVVTVTAAEKAAEEETVLARFVATVLLVGGPAVAEGGAGGRRSNPGDGLRKLNILSRGEAVATEGLAGAAVEERVGGVGGEGGAEVDRGVGAAGRATTGAAIGAEATADFATEGTVTAVATGLELVLETLVEMVGSNTGFCF